MWLQISGKWLQISGKWLQSVGSEIPGSHTFYMNDTSSHYTRLDNLFNQSDYENEFVCETERMSKSNSIVHHMRITWVIHCYAICVSFEIYLHITTNMYFLTAGLSDNISLGYLLHLWMYIIFREYWLTCFCYFAPCRL